jgi:hypothetical protein
MSGVGVGPVIWSCVRRIPIVPVDAATRAVVPVPPIQPWLTTDSTKSWRNVMANA